MLMHDKDKMEMSFFFSGRVYDFLFSGVNVVTTWGMVSLCMGLMSLSLLAEGFKVGRSLLYKVATSSYDSGCKRYSNSERVRFHILQTFLHIIQLTISYMLMLAVMTYNAYFTLAVVGGAGLGYYFFALFDLPSKLLGTYVSHSAQWPAGTSPPHLSEAVCLKEGADVASESSTNTNLTVHLTSVLESASQKEEKVKCEQQSGCANKNSQQTATYLMPVADSLEKL